MQLFYQVIFTNSRIQLNTFVAFGVIMQRKKTQTPLDNFKKKKECGYDYTITLISRK